MPDIRHLVHIKSTPEKIFKALTTQDGIASWWSPFNNAKPETGSVYRISFGGEYCKDIRVLALDAPRKIEWEIVAATPEWLNTRVTFDIRPGNDCTELRFQHSAWKSYSDMFDQCNHHWGIFLQNLKAYTENGRVMAMAEYF
jgi:uncharacterized protein YndB with AHSA1/START domain